MNIIRFLKKNNLALWLTLFIFSLVFLPIKKADATEKEAPAALLTAIKEHTTRLNARDQNLSERENRLNLLEEEVQEMLNKYIRLKEEIDQNKSVEAIAAKKLEEERIDRLAKIYQSMEAKDAASRIQKMEKKIALGLLRKIKEKQAAKILSNMSADKATLFSEAFIKADKSQP